MRQTGVTDRLRQKFLGERNIDGATSKTQVQNMNGLGYENVVFPFLALLAGLCVAILQLGIEAVIMCTKKYFDDEEHSIDDESMSDKDEEIIDDINNLLNENYSQLGGRKFLIKMRMLSSLPNAHH